MKTRHQLKKIESAYGVTEYRLENGLRVLYKQVKAAPVVAVCVTFHVGSRNEAPGHTGSTHILEHLLFKDSKNFNQKNGKAITGYLEWFGAYINATTWFDRTNYFELLPRERLGEALALEADRLRGSLFNDKDLASEMTVVRNEYERSRNNPFEYLDEELMATAFTTHPYRIPTIGTKEDIENSTAKKLREFYDTFYWPNNATLTVMGDVSWRGVEKLVKKYFTPIPASPQAIPEMTVTEPTQEGPRSVTIEKPFGVSAATLAFKTPSGVDTDFPALYVAATILSTGYSSRFEHALVTPGFAAEVTTSIMPMKDPGILSFVAHVTDHIEPKKVISVMQKEIAKFVAGGPSMQELKRARERILSEMATAHDGVFNEIRSVSEAVAAGDWRLAYTLKEAIQKLTPGDVKKAAKKYLSEAGETSAILLNKKV